MHILKNVMIYLDPLHLNIICFNNTCLLYIYKKIYSYQKLRLNLFI